jgi:hypothetical protein
MSSENKHLTRPRVGRRRRLLAVVLAASLPVVGALATETATAATVPGASAKAATDHSGPARSCESLVEVVQPDTTYTSAVYYARTATKPGHCRVELTVAPAINIAIALPDEWNGRFQGVGGGGYAGVLSNLDAAVTNGYAAGTTDTGHSREEMPIASFGLDEDGNLNWQLIEDFASRSLHEMTVKGKTLTEAYYGQDISYSYWNGCSTGGRQGLMEAQRFPNDYDGILAGAPAINWDRFIPAMLWPQLAMKQEAGGPIASCKFDLANAAAVDQCDSIDGVTDGVIGDPRRCEFDPTTLVGQHTACGEFSEADARAIQSIWDGARAPDGSFLWYGQTPGTDNSRLAGPQPDPYPVSHIANWVKQDPDWDWTTVDYSEFEDIFNESSRRFNDVIGTDNPDLSSFSEAGGKVLIWHGWSDGARRFPVIVANQLVVS